VIYMVILYSTNRQRITDTARVFLDEEAPGVSAPV